jgi:hypothetical protein
LFVSTIDISLEIFYYNFCWAGKEHRGSISILFHIPAPSIRKRLYFLKTNIEEKEKKKPKNK